MSANKIGAIVLAAALIVGAVFLRNAITSDDDSSDSSGPTDTRAPQSGDYELICSNEFADICNAITDDDIHVTIQAAGDTLDELSSANAVLPDAWLTLEPFPQMLADTRLLSSNVPTDFVATILGTTEPQIAVKSDLEEPISTLCEGTSVWACLGADAGKTWSSLDVEFGGNVEFGLADPGSEAGGLVQFATALAGFFPDASLDDRPWTTLDPSDTTFATWLRALKTQTKTYAGSQTPLGVLAVRPQINIAATTAVELDAQPSSDAFVDLDVQPSVELDATLATFNSANGPLQSEIQDALSEGGWDSPSATPPPASASTFITIRKLWRE